MTETNVVLSRKLCSNLKLNYMKIVSFQEILLNLQNVMNGRQTKGKSFAFSHQKLFIPILVVKRKRRFSYFDLISSGLSFGQTLGCNWLQSRSKESQESVDFRRDWRRFVVRVVFDGLRCGDWCQRHDNQTEDEQRSDRCFHFGDRAINLVRK